ncbi:MAG: hypothetical protein IKE23_12965 [Exiguobacterium sp.]|nr:hypothetical protein [Exiguobacterium sp.]
MTLVDVSGFGDLKFPDGGNAVVDEDSYKAGWNEALDMVMGAPEVAPTVRGKWIYKIVDDGDLFFRRRWYCSACGQWTSYGAPDFCMHCGAKMDEVET